MSGVRAIFVAGTDTGVGKTVVTSLLARSLMEDGYNVATQKWVETGRTGRSDAHTPYILKMAASPHLAARMEKKSIRISKIENSLKRLSRDFDIVIIEGSGGLLVPLNEKTLLIDIVKKLSLEVVLVAHNRLGAINHTLLSIEALKRRNIKIIGVIFNTVSKKEDNLVLKDNPRIIKKLTGVEVLGSLPYIKHL
ncbi:MAG: dethiobiotin synthase [Candidatus Omnitrophica bacterium]|nr:dethiobiotin synthase [Candidatus Omnitrophota bacterium]